MDNAAGVTPEGEKALAGVFVVPPCYLNSDLLSWESSLGVHEEEREAILSEDREVR